MRSSASLGPENIDGCLGGDQARRGAAPGSIYQIGGGAKGANLPENYEADVHAFFANARFMPNYGMTEINGTMPNCPAGHRHVPSSLLPILLDETGEEVIDYTQCDSAVGRLGLFDFTLDGRWGGVVTGDEVEMISEPCACGFNSPRLRFIRRYAEQAGGDDKLTCAGTIATYIRGVIEP